MKPAVISEGTGKAFLFLIAALSAGLQILVTIDIGGTPLRVALADLILPVAFVLIAFVAARHPASALPNWRVPYLPAGMIAMTVWLTVSIVQGRLIEGEWISWALLNKGVGWLILLGYFAVGSLLRTLAPARSKAVLIKCFVGFGIAVGAITAVMYISYKSGVPIHWDAIKDYDRVRGFSQNANAYGILCAVTLVILIAEAQYRSSLPRLATTLGGGLLVAIIALTGSRSGILAGTFGLFGLSLVGKLPWLRVATIGVAGGLMFAGIIGAAKVGDALYPEVHGGGASTYILNVPMVQGGSTDIRQTQFQAALTQWQQRPILGIGLGRFLTSGYNAASSEPATLHNTAIWVLVETGAIGLILFAGFFLYVGVSVFRCGRGNQDFDLAVVLALLCAFVGASIGTDVLYQRYFWFLAGFLLAVSREDSEPHRSGALASVDAATGCVGEPTVGQEANR